jgi:hypothetical protein
MLSNTNTVILKHIPNRIPRSYSHATKEPKYSWQLSILRESASLVLNMYPAGR